VLRDAIAETGRAALSRVVMSRRERAVAILPLESGMVLHTLHEPRDLYDYGKLFDRVPDARPDAEMVKLATQLIERQAGRFEPADLQDRYEARLREVIDAKLKGEGITPEEPPTPRGDNVIVEAQSWPGRPRTGGAGSRPAATQVNPIAQGQTGGKARRGAQAHLSGPTLRVC
jgi:DNA end-binding protein Ku